MANKSTVWDDLDGLWEDPDYPVTRSPGYGTKRDKYVVSTPACYNTHKPIQIKEGWGLLHGGNCRKHKHIDADIYVALDSGMTHPLYDGMRDHPQVAVYYPITNMGVPNRPDKFDGLIDWLTGALRQGASVHVGCIGGHGRTGMVLAAIVAKAGITDDPIQWVRDNYCVKAVESKEQVAYLVALHDCKTVKPRYGKG